MSKRKIGKKVRKNAETNFSENPGLCHRYGCNEIAQGSYCSFTCMLMDKGESS